MSASKVYFTDMRCPVGTGLLDKLKKLIEKAGIDSIDMDSKFVAIRACLETHLSIMKRFNSMLAMAI